MFIWFPDIDLYWSKMTSDLFTFVQITYLYDPAWLLQTFAIQKHMTSQTNQTLMCDAFM